jgi:MFS superfamily sulfate permease-like transporter
MEINKNILPDLSNDKVNKLANPLADIPSAIVVFLVALPLCLGIALASGAPFFSGLIAGIIGGVVVGSLSNSRVSVSGPAAGLAALVAAAIINIGDFKLFLCAVFLAGALQFGMGLLRLGGIGNYFPSSVIKGMLTSIGILIIAKQIPYATGYDRDEKGQLTELMPFGNEDWHELLKPLQHIDVGVFIVCIMAIIVMLVWDKSILKKKLPFIPGALVAVLLSVGVNAIWKATGSSMFIVEEHLVQLKVAGSAKEFLSFFTLPDFGGFTNREVIVTAIMIALIASLETLLCIEASDNLDPQRCVTNTNRELIAQGAGNMVSGLIGGLPITSVIVRTTANINAGAKSKYSSILHGVLLLACTIAIPSLLNYIPLSALAAILLLTGYKLCNFTVFKNMWSQGKHQFIPFIVTVAVIIGIDLLGVYKPLKGEGLLVGVLIGVVVAIGSLLHANLKNSHYSKDVMEGDVKHMYLSEEVSFLNKAAIRAELDKVPANSSIIIDALNTKYIDFDVLELIKEFKEIKAPYKNIQCELKGIRQDYKMY